MKDKKNTNEELTKLFEDALVQAFDLNTTLQH